METFEIISVQKGVRKSHETLVSEEVPLTIVLNGKELATLLCSPDHVENLVTGFLYTSGLIQEKSDVKSIVVDRDRWNASADIKEEGFDERLVFKRIYTSGCGKGVIFHNPIDLLNRTQIPDSFQIKADSLSLKMKEFQGMSQEYGSTHGVHSSALATAEEILIFREDIGRHNAMDKVIGEALVKGIGFTDKVLLTSGRISSEILSKVLRCRMPIISAAGAPTNQSVKLARQVNLTLAGRVKGGRINIYSGENRIC